MVSMVGGAAPQAHDLFERIRARAADVPEMSFHGQSSRFAA